MPQPYPSPLPYSGSSELARYVASVLAAQRITPILAGLAIAPEVLRSGGPRPVPIALAVIFAAIGWQASFRYRRNPGSVRALMWMLDGLTLSLAGLVPLALILMAQTWAANYTLYERYAPACVGLAIVVFIYMTFLRGGAHKRGLEAQIAGLRAGAERGQLGEQEFYSILMVVPGARSAVQNWGAARFQAILGPVTVGFMVLIATKRGDGLLLGAFLLVVGVGVPLLLASVALRRISVLRGLGTRDIRLVADGRPGAGLIVR